MKSLTILLLLQLTSVLSNIDPPCFNNCQTCWDATSPYMCNSCVPSTYLFVSSCQLDNYIGSTFENNINASFYGLSAMCCGLMIILVSLGLGTYREAFQNLQLIALFCWGYNTQYGGQPLMIVNFCYVKTGMSGTPLILFLLVGVTLFLFGISILALTTRLSKNSLAVLLKRKQTIFPFRLYHLTFNPLLFASCNQFLNASLNDMPQKGPFAISVLCVIFLTGMYVTYCHILSGVDSQKDPRAKVFFQNHSVVKFFTSCHILASLFFRALNICIFVFNFQNVVLTMVILSISQSIYTIYLCVGVKYNKRRYFIVNLASNVLVVAQVLIAGFAALNFQGNRTSFQTLSTAWMSISLVSLVGLCIIQSIQILANFMQIKRQIRSIYCRYILCEEDENGVVLNVYDEGFNKSRVETFTPNPLHRKKIELQQLDGAL